MLPLKFRWVSRDNSTASSIRQRGACFLGNGDTFRKQLASLWCRDVAVCCRLCDQFSDDLYLDEGARVLLRAGAARIACSQ